MKTIETVTLGCLTMLTLAGLAFSTPGFAAHPDRVDVIGTLHDKGAQLDSNKNGGQGMRVDVVERIDPRGPAYPYTKPISR
jgi:hypothetical protein